MSSKGAHYWSKFTNNNKCSCAFKDHEVLDFCIIELSMTGEGVKFAWEVIRQTMAFITNNKSTTYNGGIKALTHDALALRCKCSQHGNLNSFIVECGKEGKAEIIDGLYSTVLSVQCVASAKSGGSTLAKKLEYYVSKLPIYYSLINNNCSHVAGNAYEFCLKNA